MKQKLDEISTIMISIILVLVPLAFIPNDVDNPSKLKFIILAICGAVLFITLILKVRTIKISIADIFILIFAILAIISTIFSLDVKQSIFGKTTRYEGLITIIIYISIYFHAKNSFIKYKGLKPIILTTYIAICLIAILQYYIPSKYGNPPLFGNGAHGTMGNTNFMGSFVTLILPVFIFLYITKNKKAYLFCSTIAFIAMIVCVARSSWVAFGFYMIIFLIYLIIKKDKKYWRNFLILVVIFVISTTVITMTKKKNVVISKVNSIQRDIKTVKETGVTNNKLGSNRIEIWKMTLKVIEKSPLIGCGVDALEYGVIKYAPDEVVDYIFRTGQYVDKAHNEYLHIAATIGIPALIAYLGFIGSIFFSGIKNAFKDERILILLIIITSYLIQAFFNISTIAVAPIFWFILGITANYINSKN